MKFFVLPIIGLLIYSMTLLIVTLPWLTGDTYNEKRIFEIIILLLTLTSHVFISYKFALPLLIKFLFIGLFSLGLLSVVTANVINYAFIEYSIFVGLFCYAILVSYLYNEHEHLLRYYSHLVIYAAFLYFFVVLVSYFAALTTEIGYDWDELFFGFVNIRFFNQYQVWLLPFLTFALLCLKDPVHKKIVFVITVVWWALLFLSVARGAILAISCAGLILYVFYGQTIAKYLKLHLTLAILGYGLNLILFHAIPDLVVSSDGQASNNITRPLLSVYAPERLVLWEKALLILKENMLLGIGPMHFSLETLNHPHNSVLQWAGEWGVPSLILMLALTYSALFAWFKGFNKAFYKKNKQNELALGTLALSYAILSGLGYSLVSGVIVMPLSQIMMFTTIGLMLGHYKNHFPTKEDYVLIKGETLIWRSFILGVVVLFIAALLDINIQNKIYGVEQNIQKLEVYGPRLWRIGGIPHN